MNQQYRQKIVLLLLFIGFFIISFDAQAQQRRSTQFYHNWALTVNGGSNLFYGDLRVYNFVPVSENHSEWGWAFGGALTKYLNPHWSVRGQFVYGDLAGTKRTINRYFLADIFEYSLALQLDFSNLLWRRNFNKPVNFYGYAGLGMANWQTNLYDLNTDVKVGGNGQAGNGISGWTTEAVFPAGLGMKINIGDHLDINFEGSLRITNSDKLDATEGGSSYDMYGYTSMGISYYFNKKPVRRERDVEPVIADDGPQFDIRYDIPVRTQTNGEFDMKLIIDRGQLKGKSTITQILPSGFTASDPYVLNGKFSFADKKVTIDFDSLPNLNSFTISYKVNVGEIGSGTYPIIGEFVDENGKIYQFNNNIYVEKPVVKDETPVAVVIDKPIVDDKQGKTRGVEYRVQIRAAFGKKIEEGYLEDKYKITDEIRENYIDGWYKYSVGSYDNYEDAEVYRNEIRTKNGIKDAFVVKYKDGEPFSRSKYGSGKESATTKYIMESESQSKIYESPWEGVDFKVQIAASYGEKLSTQSLKDRYHLDQEVYEHGNNGWYRYSVGSCQKYWQAKELRNVLISRHDVKDAFVVAYEDGNRLSNLSQLIGGGKIRDTDAPLYEESGVKFRIQLLALKNKSDGAVQALKSKYNLTETINEELVYGWYQYTIGEFTSFEAAKQKKQEYTDKGIKDAFVVAYKDGKRIRLSQAFK